MPSGPAVGEKARVIAEEPLKARAFALLQQEKTARDGDGEKRALGGGGQAPDNVKHGFLLIAVYSARQAGFQARGAA